MADDAPGSASPKIASSEKFVDVGSVAPDFTLNDDSGKPVTLSDFRGKQNVVLFFYPADSTPGCTRQACSFQNHIKAFKDLDVAIFGVSGQDKESKQRFKAKFGLTMPLLIDEKNELRKAWKIKGDMLGILPARITYVIDKEGTVKLAYRSQMAPASHVGRALEALEAL